MRMLLRLLAPLSALALATAGALIALEAAWAWVRPGSAALLVPWRQWRDGLAGYSWSDVAVLVAGAALVLAGLVLLLVAGRAGRRDVPMAEPAGDVTVVTTPRSLARAVGQHVREVDGVRAASVTATARTVRVRAESRSHSGAELHPALLARVTGMLAGLPLVRMPRVRVIVRSREYRR